MLSLSRCGLRIAVQTGLFLEQFLPHLKVDQVSRTAEHPLYKEVLIFDGRCALFIDQPMTYCSQYGMQRTALRGLILRFFATGDFNFGTE